MYLQSKWKKVDIKNKIFTQQNFLDEDTRKKLIEDIEYEARTRPYIGDNTPPLQTHPDLLKKYKTPHWNIYKKSIDKFVNKKLNCNMTFGHVWANISVPNVKYKFHKHTCDFSVVLYLQNKFSDFGTYLENDIIIPGHQNSILMFKGDILHSIINMPKNIISKNRRVSLVCDLYYDDV